MQNSAAARLVAGPYSEESVIEAAKETLQAIGGKVTCGIVFVSSDYREHLSDFLELVQVHGHVPVFIGCSSSGVIANGLEAEQASGFSLLFLHLPKTKVKVFTFGKDDAESLAEPEEWRRAAGTDAVGVDAWIALGDPTTLPAEAWIHDWNRAFPGVPVLGGLASGGVADTDFFVFHDHGVVEACAMLGLTGGVAVHSIVSQGCRPVGEPFTITGAGQNLVTALGSRPAFERLTQTVDNLPDGDRAQARGNFFAGLAMSEYVDDFKTGDFLIRNLIAADPKSGAIAIAAEPRIGQTLQFQLRDRASAHDELHRMLAASASLGLRPFASLAFSCNGRGRHLFGVPNHDASAIGEHFGPIPSAGFFCNGEIGPVGGRNFVHGYTASIALLTDAPE